MPLRMLLLRADDDWRAAFELAQAALALDHGLELGFAGDGLALLRADVDAPVSARAFASLSLLGLERVSAPLPAPPLPGSKLPVQWLDASAWRAWLRAGPLQIF